MRHPGCPYRTDIKVVRVGTEFRADLILVRTGAPDHRGGLEFRTGPSGSSGFPGNQITHSAMLNQHSETSNVIDHMFHIIS